MTMILDGTNGEVFPTWTTATRPASPVVAQVGWNTTIGSLENYNGSAWTAVGGGGPGTVSVQTTGFTAASGGVYACNTTSAAFTATLPASPTAGSFVTFFDYAGTFATNALTINPNGGKIQGNTANVPMNINNEAASFIYVDSTKGWFAYSGLVSNPFGNYSINYLIAAGGGGSGAGGGGSGGGGAGGLIQATTTAIPGTAYTISVGAGGAQTANGSNSSAFSQTAIGGGAGGRGAPGQNGFAGGSGGGAGGQDTTAYSPGAGTSGQGNAGGYMANGANYGAGGGGGAGAVGANGTTAVSGNGGVGTSSTITGTAVYYCGGGGGGTTISGASGGAGGSGGGGGNGASGTANTGGGGGGNGGAGGSGVVIVSYLGGARATGGTITSAGGYTIHTFTSSGTFTA